MKITRNILFLLMIPVSIIFSSCNKFTQFNIEYEQSFTVPSSTGINAPFNLYSPDMETNSEYKFEVNDTRKDLIEEILLSDLSISLSSPNNADFSFLKSANIYISADGLSEVEVAYISSVSANPGNELIMTTTKADLQDYIKKDSFTLRLKTVTDEIITQDHEINVNSIFFVDAKLTRR